MAIPCPLVTMMNKKGNSGSPCLIPLVGKKVMEGDPLRRMEKSVVDMRAFIH